MTSNPASVGPAPDGEGWIEWSGGPRPHAPNTRVQVRYRDGTRDVGASAFARWWHDEILPERDIIAYRIAPHPDREAEPTGGVVVTRDLLESAMRIIRAFSPQSWAAKAIEEALSVSPPVVEGLGALQAQAPSVPTECPETAVVGDALTERLAKVAYATEFLDVREDILALVERDRKRWLDNIAMCELLAKARAKLADHPSGAPDRPRR